MVDKTRYTIRTIADIWALPTIEAMDRCLSELRDLMAASRLLSDAAGPSALNVDDLDKFPNVLIWFDDEPGTPSTMRITAPDLEKPFELSIPHAKREN